ncbi:MAG: hypothetical protein D3904_17900 [Candidatus Electrothrix sp. EH2]|nr:hypothetical protein [Candidatus Electrothrix sp. EH2]
MRNSVNHEIDDVLNRRSNKTGSSADSLFFIKAQNIVKAAAWCVKRFLRLKQDKLYPIQKRTS